MSALIVCLGPVRNAVDQSARLGADESQRTVVDRVLADIRAGHHPYVPTFDELERRQQQGRAPLQVVRA